MIDRYLSVLQEHSLDFVNSLSDLIDTLNAHSEDWATKVGQTVMAITGRLSPHDSYFDVGAAFIQYVRKN